MSASNRASGRRSVNLNAVTAMVRDRAGTMIQPIRFLDLNRHVPIGTPLEDVARQLGLEKIELPPGYRKDRMDLFLAGDRKAFERYALRDAEIVARHYIRLRDFARKHAGVKALPGTA